MELTDKVKLSQFKLELSKLGPITAVLTKQDCFNFLDTIEALRREGKS